MNILNNSFTGYPSIKKKIPLFFFEQVLIKLIKQNNKCKLNQFHQHSEVFNKLSTAHKSTINSEKVHLNGVLINHDNVKSLSFSHILIIKSSQYSLTLWFVELFSPRYSFFYIICITITGNCVRDTVMKWKIPVLLSSSSCMNLN